MPRLSSVAAEVTPFALAGEPMPPPAELTEEQADFWRAIVDPFPPERFQPDAVPVLLELVRHMSLCRKLSEELDGMRQTRLIGPSPERAKVRQIYLQLARMHMAESHLVAMLCTKLRMVDQAKIEKRMAEAAQRGMATGVPPWAQA